MKRLILTGDDFGRSAAVNEAIERHYRAGLLTQASLMVNEPGAEEAVRIARRNPGLCVGLHLALCAGSAARISPITDAAGRFPESAALAGLRYAFDPASAAAVREEITAQFARFREFGFDAAYLDGHLHLHLHPAILRSLLGPLRESGCRMVRLVQEPGNHSPIALIFRALSARAGRALRRIGILASDRVYGLRFSGRMTNGPLASLLAQLPDGLSEIYFHPGTEPAEPDFAMLRDILAERRITLTSAKSVFQPLMNTDER